MADQIKKRQVKRKIILESIFVFFIAISPFLYKIYDYLPEDPEATISFLGITIGNKGFADVSTFVWFMASKIIPLYLLVFWFLSSKDWWYHIILIPIAMYAFQIFEVLYSHDDDIDTENIWWLLPICMVIVPMVYFIRIKLYDKYVHGIDLEAMDAELKSAKPEKRENFVSDKSDQEKLEKEKIEEPLIGYQSFSDYINTKLSTDNLERQFKRFQNNLKGWLHLKF